MKSKNVFDLENISNNNVNKVFAKLDLKEKENIIKIRQLKEELKIIGLMVNPQTLFHVNNNDVLKDENFLEKLQYIMKVLKIQPVNLFKEKKKQVEEKVKVEKKKKEHSLNSFKSTDITIFENVLLKSAKEQKRKTNVEVDPAKVLANLIEFRKQSKAKSCEKKSSDPYNHYLNQLKKIQADIDIECII